MEPTRVFGAGQETVLPPEVVLAGASDVSARRAKIWPNVTEGHFEVHERGEDWAEVTEYLHPVGFWERSRYDWSEPGRLVGTVLDSNTLQPGSTWTLTAMPTESGSHVETEFRRDFLPTLRGRIGKLLNRGGHSFARSHLRKALKEIEAEYGRASERDR
jgi:hypothetical protein